MGRFPKSKEAYGQSTRSRSGTWEGTAGRLRVWVPQRCGCASALFRRRLLDLPRVPLRFPLRRQALG